jgi:hypothetical protein
MTWRCPPGEVSMVTKATCAWATVASSRAAAAANCPRAIRFLTRHHFSGASLAVEIWRIVRPVDRHEDRLSPAEWMIRVFICLLPFALGTRSIGLSKGIENTAMILGANKE